MASTMTMSGTPLHFPESYAQDERGMIIAPPREALPPLASAVRPDQLMLFTTRLIRNARKWARTPRHAEVNERRLELARLCINRILIENLSGRPAWDAAMQRYEQAARLSKEPSDVRNEVLRLPAPDIAALRWKLQALFFDGCNEADDRLIEQVKSDVTRLLRDLSE